MELMMNQSVLAGGRADSTEHPGPDLRIALHLQIDLWLLRVITSDLLHNHDSAGACPAGAAVILPSSQAAEHEPSPIRH